MRQDVVSKRVGIWIAFPHERRARLYAEAKDWMSLRYIALPCPARR